MKIRSAKDISIWRLCVGCGACVYICPKKSISLMDVVNDGIRPVIDGDNCEDCRQCLKVCPGYETVHGHESLDNGTISSLKRGWGPILEIWEGYAADKDIRNHGSSGGLASALALYCLEKKDMHGVLHIGADEKVPYRNKTVMSRSRSDILSRTGSRYSPASPCDGLEKIESAPGECVFIGKPCDVAALRKAQGLKQDLDRKIGVAIGIFCAGTPSTQGTIDLLEKVHVNAENLEEIRYRGKGWPGMTAVRSKGEQSASDKLTYKESWGFLAQYRPYRCYLCPDGTSEFADISCGDPWHREIQGKEEGFSLALVRTSKGAEILQGAIEAGYVVLKKEDSAILKASQMNLLMKRSAIWGRLLSLKILGVPTPMLGGFSLFKNWLSLPLSGKARSVFGTARRIVQRKYYKANL